VFFDPRPKRRRVDLYDFDDEFNALKDYLGQPLTVVSGLRRTGKTSLIMTVLEEMSAPYIFVDMRGIVGSLRDLYSTLSHSVSDFMLRLSRLQFLRDSILKFLRVLRGVSLSGFSVEFSWGREKPSLIELLTAIDAAAGEHGVKVVIVFDEFQNAVGKTGLLLHNAIAYSYDYLRSVSFIISGSEMGVMYRALKNPEAPLYGRAYLEVKTRRLTRRESLDFLEKGFSQLGYTPPTTEIEEVVDRLDGVIGWLTYYGYLRTHGGKGLDEVWEQAVELARKELENFLGSRVSKSRYRAVLRLLAQGIREWSRLKNKLEDIEGKPVSDRVLHDILQTLRNHSIIDENNTFLDPLIETAATSI